MNVKFTKAQTCKVLEKYYKEQEDVEGKVTIKESECEVGCDMYSHTEVLVDMRIRGNLELNGLKVPLEKEITPEDMDEAFNYFIGDMDIEVSSIHFDKGISSETVGYHMSERTVTKPYFNGVVVTFKKKSKKRGGK